MTPALPFPMVAPVPTQISNLALRLLRVHAADPHSLAFLPSGANPVPQTKQLPRHLHHVASISLPFSAASAHFPSSRGCTLHHSQRQTLRPSGMPTLLLSKACSLFVVSLRSFLRSLPLFSIVCSLFLQNTRVGCYRCSSFRCYRKGQLPLPPRLGEFKSCPARILF